MDSSGAKVPDEEYPDLLEVLNIKGLNEEIRNKEDAPSELIHAQMSLLNASTSVYLSNREKEKSSSATMTAMSFHGDIFGQRELAEEQSSSTSGLTTVSGRDTDQSPEIGLFTESRADHAERPQN